MGLTDINTTLVLVFTLSFLVTYYSAKTVLKKYSRKGRLLKQARADFAVLQTNYTLAMSKNDIRFLKHGFFYFASNAWRTQDSTSLKNFLQNPVVAMHIDAGQYLANDVKQRSLLKKLGELNRSNGDPFKQRSLLDELVTSIPSS